MRGAMELQSETKRRTVLKLGIVGGALLSAGGLSWVGLRSTKLGAAPRRPLQALNLKEFAVVNALAECMMTTEGFVSEKDAQQSPWPSAWSLYCPEKVDAVVASLHPEATAEFKQLLGLFENGLSGLLTTGRPTPFTQLPLQARRDRLNAWRKSRISLLRSGYLALTQLIHATYHSSPEVYAAMGYPGPPDVPFVPNETEKEQRQ
jgi:hypothetical protein